MKKTFAFIGVAALSAGAIAGPFDNVLIKGRTDKDNPVSYKVGEPIVFTLTTTDSAGIDFTNTPYQVRWTRTGDDGRVVKGVSPWTDGVTCVVTTKLDRAGMVRLEAQVYDQDGKKVMRDKPAPGSPGWSPVKDIMFDGGAGVDVAQIRPFKMEPADFDEFWDEQKALLAEIPLKAQRKDVKTVNGAKIYEVYVDCYGPRPVSGYLFIPDGAQAKSCKARVAFQGYGFYKQACPEWASKGVATNQEIFLEINAHGYELGRDQAYYDDFGKKIRTEKYSYAFSPEENATPETAYFRYMAMRVMRALQYVKSLPEWNGKDLVVEGGSQGGLQTSWAAGLDPDVTLARPSVTWCCDLAATQPGGRLHGPWFIPYAPGLAYYDSVYHIARAKCPVEITRAGLGDYTCPPSGLAAYYNAIPGPKSIKWVQGSRHGFVPPEPNQVFVIEENHQQTGDESKSQNASADVK